MISLFAPCSPVCHCHLRRFVQQVVLLKMVKQQRKVGSWEGIIVRNTKDVFKPTPSMSWFLRKRNQSVSCFIGIKTGRFGCSGKEFILGRLWRCFVRLVVGDSSQTGRSIDTAETRPTIGRFRRFVKVDTSPRIRIADTPDTGACERSWW